MLWAISLVVPAVAVSILSISLAHAQQAPARANPQPVEISGFRQVIKGDQLVAGFLTELNGKYRLRVSEATFDPGGRVGQHFHAGPGFRCVISGEIANEEPSKTEVIRAGQCFWEAGDISHTPQNRTDKPAVLLVFELLAASLAGRSIVPINPEK